LRYNPRWYSGGAGAAATLRLKHKRETEGVNSNNQQQNKTTTMVLTTLKKRREKEKKKAAHVVAYEQPHSVTV